MGECTKVQCTPLTSRKSGSIVENASLIDDERCVLVGIAKDLAD
jgi:hypothetical protein